MSQVPEKNLNRYDILDRIAVGGMAEVFLAKAYGAHGFEKTLAIKRILPELARDPEFEERFIAEAKVAVRLSHTNVVQVFDFGRFAGSLFIAMEYVDGLDLAALLRRLKLRGERVPVTAAFQIAIELARGLDFAHQHGVVHRDVSPSNILLSRAGEVKIADFGIAIAAAPPRSGTVTGRRKVMGKWRYMSPEQARGEPLDTRSDLFSAASVMYELFTGEKLFTGDEAEDIIRNIHDMPLPRPSEVRPGLPPRLDAILHAALARSRDDRPARPAIMLRALTELTYESSIVSTALDVAELVSDTVDRSTPTGKRLDAIIRAQLAGIAESTRARRTAGSERQTADGGERRTAEASVSGAVGDDELGLRGTDPALAEAADGGDPPRRARTLATEPTLDARLGSSGPIPIVDDDLSDGRPVLISRVDSDGISRLELDETTIAGAPWPRLGEPPAIPPSNPGLVATKAGPARPAAAGPSPSETAILAPARGRRRWLVGGALAATAAVAVTLMLTADREPSTAVAPVVTLDAGVDAAVAVKARLELDSVPPGAIATVGGVVQGPTPIIVEVPAGSIEVRLDLTGYAPYLDSLTVSAGQIVRLRAPLPAALAQLAVASRPPGASVLLDGELVGVTPLTLTQRAAGRTRIALELADHLPATGTVELVAGRETRFERTLQRAPTPTGVIQLQIQDGWGEVYLKGRKVGKAPNQALALPVGRHRLRIVNPPSGREVWLDVEVEVGRSRYYSTRFPS